MSVEVVLHYRPGLSDKRKLKRIAEAALEEFPTRILPVFLPLFPNEKGKLPLKPKLQPPLISSEDMGNLQNRFPVSEHLNSPPNFDCTVGLLEFQPSLNQRKRLLRAQTIHLDVNSGRPEKISFNKNQALRRRWSVSVPSDSCKDKCIPLSKELQYTLQRLNLHSFYRARWTIEGTVCGSQALEDIWIRLNSFIRRKELPTCNATIQRDVGQIWVFCDILYCEYIGDFLKKRLHLVGTINLLVPKCGVIYSM